ncbi:hypothetical protein [Dolichospermum flos-aquae]|uniref:RDD domain-containing protein n=1 Tax=Dolichospermum flos-aquae CCAP 1403/13F TaxID=315271 RepID=A0A6H2C2L2_DOLFA|nr:hypothetical protein [Dolichospermum flos-aquae]QJB45446.1 hypothetical protein HGD76_15980 [Dolichospermum flos-aquae CCAP 1403/13F]
MNLKQTISVLVSVIGMGLFGMKSVEAKNAFIKAPFTTDSTQNTPSSAFTIAQITEASYPLYGSWKLTYSVNGTVYKGYLIMRGYYGDLRVSYFDPEIRKKATIDQGMKLMSSSQGLVLLGYNPVYAGTSISHPTYAADNFVFSTQPDGSLVAVTCDYLEQCSSVDVEFIE